MSKKDRETVDQLRNAPEIDFDAFNDRVREEAKFIKRELSEGTFDNSQRALGLEHEFYAVDRETTKLRRVPRSLLSSLGFERELGLHNAELNTGVQPHTAPGIEALLQDVEAKVDAIDREAAAHGLRLVSDGMWTIGPEHHEAARYLTQATHEEGLVLSINVSNAVRYHGFASGGREINCTIDVPGVTLEPSEPGAVSLTTSIQPHFQLRRANDLPERFGAALRVAGPLLALAVNSPFFPPSLYDAPKPDRQTLLEEAHAENRISVYEQMMNPIDRSRKVRFPKDIDSPEQAVDRIVADPVLVPAAIDAGERFDDEFVHFRHQHGSFWRWIRPVFDGATEDAANARIEFRPLAAQPTLRDTGALLAAVAGLLVAVPEREHPIADLSWEAARDNFYLAADDGLEAELTWISADGDRTNDSDRLFTELLDLATDGLQLQGFDRKTAANVIAPLRGRVDRGVTPAEWKRRAVAARLDAGSDPKEAIHGMQRAYVDRQQATFFDGRLDEWPVPGSQP